MPLDSTAPAGPPMGGRIQLARELRGYTQRRVTELMGSSISPPALSQIEAGKTRPSPSTLLQLADALEVPAGFFSAAWPGGDQRPTFFRDLRGTSARDRRRAAAQTVLLADFVAALGQHVRFPDVDVPRIAAPRGATRSEIEEIAAEVRSHWQLGTEPIPHVVRELERHGVIVARLSLGHESVDAFSTARDGRPLVLLTDDKADNYVRSRFDAAHELGHLVMHEGTEPGTKEVEGQAHDFASSFLMPEAVARSLLPDRLDASGWSRVAELKRTWGISIGALLFRAKSLGILSPDAYLGAMKYMSARGWRKQEPGDREMGAPEAPLLLERSVRRAEFERGATLEALIESAHLPVDDLVDIIDAAVDDRPIIEL